MRLELSRGRIEYNSTRQEEVKNVRRSLSSGLVMANVDDDGGGDE